MWLHRNDCLHTSDSIKDQIYNLPELNSKIRRQWQIGTQALHSADKLHFRTLTLPQLLRKSREYKRTWLSNIEKARKSIHKESSDEDSSQVSD